MGQMGAWERSGQLSRILKDFQSLFLQGQADDDHNSVVRWRRTLLDFLEALLSSYRRQEDDDSPWVHFNFEPLRLVINHSCCNWASPAAFQCGLMAEIVRALTKVQSALPVSTPAILHVLLHRLATLSPGREKDGRYGVLVTGLRETLDACPALPSETLVTSLDDCLRRPSSAAAWSMRAAQFLVRGVLSLVMQSPRSLCRAVVPVLVRFAAENECGMNGSLSADSSSTLSTKNSSRDTRCSSCVAVGWPLTRDESVNLRENRPSRCATQETRDIVLQTLLVWVVEAHFRESSALLQAPLHLAVYEGIRQALDAASTAAGRVSPPYFPLACRVLLSVTGRVAGDGGGKVALFLRELCADELQHFLARPEVCTRPRNPKVARRQAAEDDELEFSGMPMLEGYVGHLCLCRHVSNEVVSSHLVWLSRQALGVLRKLNDLKHSDIRVGRTQSSRGTAGFLRSLCRALALLLCRRQRVGGSVAPVPPDAGNLLEIIFDSDACPLASLPRTLADAAVDALRKSGFMHLFRTGALLRSSIPRSSRKGKAEAKKTNNAIQGRSSTDGVDFRGADIAFRRSWSVIANGVDQYSPQSFQDKDLEDTDNEGASGEDEGYESNGQDWDYESCDSADYCIRLPDEVTVRVFSFMTPKRLSRLACVNRTWRELFRVDWIWRPFFETRWPLKTLTSQADLPGVSKMLLLGVDCSGEGKRKNKRRRRFVVHWEIPPEVDDHGHAAPTRDWMALYRDRHRAELTARRRFASKTNFQWMVCPFLGCLSLLKSEFAVKRHVQTHKPKVRRRAKRLPARVDKKGGKTDQSR